MATLEKEIDDRYVQEKQVPSPQAHIEDVQEEVGSVAPLKRALEGRHMQMIAIVSPNFSPYASGLRRAAGSWGVKEMASN